MALITPEEAARRKRRGWMHVDVRSPEEYIRLHPSCTVNVPLDNRFIARISRMYSTSTKLVISCSSGRRSTRAALLLTANGYFHVVVIYRGLVAWVAAELPCSVVSSTPGKIIKVRATCL